MAKAPKWKAAGYKSKSAYYRDHPAGQKQKRVGAKPKAARKRKANRQAPKMPPAIEGKIAQQIEREDFAKRTADSAVRKALAEVLISGCERVLSELTDAGPYRSVMIGMTVPQIRVVLNGLRRIVAEEG